MIVNPRELTEKGEAIYYSSHALPIIDNTVIDFLKSAARTVPRRRARFCAHPTAQAEQHDMLIVSHRDTYVTPHRHFGKSKSFLILEGTADILLFSEDGNIDAVIKMGPQESGLPFFYRMPAEKFHSLAIESELLVFVESTKGPFDLADREHAVWAPDPDDTEKGRAYIASLLKK